MTGDEGGPQPGDPTPVVGGQTGLAHGLRRGIARVGGELRLETFGGLVPAAPATASLAADCYGTRWAYRHHPGAAWAAGIAPSAVLLRGAWLGLRPGKPRTRSGKLAAGAAGAFRLWLPARLGYPDFGTAFA
ncbi:hypothetical protein AB0K43_04490 [Kitasatospora sp. NPDC049258]|uniref:hypothetical protein n=1 Tax=Kitasatospora sp. NPDC049258 TaxID=3155394 RepID=UPI00343A837A